MTTVTVEFRKHTGKKRTKLGVFEIEHAQYMVFASTDQVKQPQFIGYIGKAEGSPFNGYTSFRDLPAEVKALVIADIKRQVKWDPEIFEPTLPPEVVTLVDDGGGEPDEEEVEQ